MRLWARARLYSPRVAIGLPLSSASGGALRKSPLLCIYTRERSAERRAFTQWPVAIQATRSACCRRNYACARAAYARRRRLPVGGANGSGFPLGSVRRNVDSAADACAAATVRTRHSRRSVKKGGEGGAVSVQRLPFTSICCRCCRARRARTETTTSTRCPRAHVPIALASAPLCSKG